jgi:hypothetical protein
LRLGPKGRAVFTKSGWNDALRNAGLYAGNWWIANYGPLRWNTGYAQAHLGYPPRLPRGSMKGIRAMFAGGLADGWTKRERLKMGEAPFFYTGTMQANFNSRARTEATASAGGARFWIVCPVGHPLRPETADAFKTVPPGERKAVAREFRRALIQALMAQRIVAAKAKAERVAQRAMVRKQRAEMRAKVRADAKAQARADKASIRAAARQMRRNRVRGKHRIALV